MSKSRLLVLGLALGCAGFAAFLANGFIGSEPQKEVVEVTRVPTTSVLVAIKDIEIGERLDQANLSWTDWPRNNVAATMITRDARPEIMKELATARARVQMYQGEPLDERRIVQVSDAGFMAALLPKGMRGISVRISAETGAGGFILPNDRVDVILTKKDTNNREISETVLTNVRVLAVDQTFRQNDKGEQVVVGKTATLELEPRQAEILALVESSGQLTLALRSLADRGDKELGDDGPRVAERYSKGGRGNEISVIRYGVEKLTATKD